MVNALSIKKDGLVHLAPNLLAKQLLEIESQLLLGTVSKKKVS